MHDRLKSNTDFYNDRTRKQDVFVKARRVEI